MTEPTPDWQAPAGSGTTASGATAAGASAASTANYSTATSGDGRLRDPSDVSVGQLMGDISRDLSRLMRQELELAKAELKQEASKAAKGAGMLGGAGFAGYLLLLFLSLALAWALSAPVGAGWAHLIVGALWGLVALGLFAVGRKKLQQVHPKPEQTVETVGQIPSALKPNS